VKTVECGIRYDLSDQNILAYHIFSVYALTLPKVKGKVSPLQTRCGPEGA